MISRPRFLRLLLLRRQLHPRPQILMNLTQLQLNILSVTKTVARHSASSSTSPPTDSLLQSSSSSAQSKA
ncbi:unnamed protein product [Linum trigynum]|uniref:Uncharacterized protein n=1 Tax=Linum trigynum TaxID=586398 RepID=A0AAV2E6Y8_9ROSI